MNKFLILLLSLNILYANSDNKNDLIDLTLAKELFNKGEYSKSYDILNQLFLNDFDNTDINYYLAKSALKLEKFGFANAAFDRILIKEDNNYFIMFEQAKLSYLQGNKKLAISNMEELLKEKLSDSLRKEIEKFIDFAKDKKVEFVATNVTRKFASYVSKNGLSSLDTISTEDKKLIAKLPLEIDYDAPGYPEMIKMMGDHAGIKAKQFVAAQALKDATMSETILQHYKADNLFIHYNGDYHSKNYGGIYWFLKKSNPNLKIAVIEILEGADEKLSIVKPKEENFSTTEFIIVFPKDAPKTF